MKLRSIWWGLLIAVMLAVAPARADETAGGWSHRDLPSYPDLLRNMKIGGHVRLTVTVSNDGKVKQTTVRGGNPVLAELSCAAVKKWVRTGIATGSTVEIEFVFDPRAGVTVEGQ